MEVIIIFTFVIIIVWLKNHYHRKETEMKTNAVIKYLETAGPKQDASGIIAMIEDKPDYRALLIKRLKGGIIWTGIGLVWLILLVVFSLSKRIEQTPVTGDGLSDTASNPILCWLVPCILIIVGVSKLISSYLFKKTYHEEIEIEREKKVRDARKA